MFGRVATVSNPANNKMPITKTLDLKKIRTDFPILDSKINGKPLTYLDSAATSQKPLSVIRRIEKFMREENATVRRGLYSLSARSTKAFDDVRSQVARFINASSSDEIIFTRGTTEAINLVASCLSRAVLKAGDEILISELEHHANIVPWQIVTSDIGIHQLEPEQRVELAKKTKTQAIKVIPVLDNGELDLQAYDTLISSGKVKILALTHIANSTGTIVPVKAMIAKAHEHGVIVLIDGAQAIQHLAVDVQELDADFYVFSGHKLYGPTGIGVLYGKRKLLEMMPPYHGGGEMIDKVSTEETSYAAIPYKFEAGTPAIAEVIGLGEAIRYIQELGLANISSYENELAEYALAKLLEINGLQVISQTKPGDFRTAKKASLISFIIDGVESFDLGTLLNEHGVAIRVGHHCAQPLMKRYAVIATARLSVAFYNTKEDIDRFIEALKKVIAILKG